MNLDRKAIRNKAKDAPTLDHVFPIAGLGDLNRGNVLAVHWRCNNLKGARHPTDQQVETLRAVNAKLRWATPPPPLLKAAKLSSADLEALHNLNPCLTTLS